MAGLASLPVRKKAAAMASFVILGLSPTYLEWKQQPDKRPQIVVYYLVAGGLFYYGLLS